MHRSVGGTYLYMCIYDVFWKQNSRTAPELRDHILLTWIDPFQEFLDPVHPNKKKSRSIRDTFGIPGRIDGGVEVWH